MVSSIPASQLWPGFLVWCCYNCCCSCCISSYSRWCSLVLGFVALFHFYLIVGLSGLLFLFFVLFLLQLLTASVWVQVWDSDWITAFSCGRCCCYYLLCILIAFHYICYRPTVQRTYRPKALSPPSGWNHFCESCWPKSSGILAKLIHSNRQN